VSESLAGRAAILHLHPLSISEGFKLTASPVKNFPSYVERLSKVNSASRIDSASLGPWLLDGCYPELHQKRKISRQLWYASYVQTYLDRDVRGNIKETNLHDFQRFLKLLAARTGTELNQASLSRELGVSIPTIRSWISLLEASSLIYLLPPYHKNYGKRIIKSPKLYFMDTGLVCYLVGLQTGEHLLNSPMAGALFETAVVTNFKKVSDATIHPDSLFYWRAVSGLEVDLVIDLAGDLHPIEIKLSATINPQHYSSLTQWRHLTSSRAKGLLISQSKDVGAVGPDIVNVHWTLL
jgi:predicted AAA+ superfamily ATPase